MAAIQYSFQRHEKKFLLTPEQYRAILPLLAERMEADRYGEYTICSLYYDTPAFDLIRASVQKPPYKEKFRLRSYGTTRSRQPHRFAVRLPACLIAN